eukprot:5713549-Prymnesium_polylepis.1
MVRRYLDDCQGRTTLCPWQTLTATPAPTWQKSDTRCAGRRYRRGCIALQTQSHSTDQVYWVCPTQ